MENKKISFSILDQEKKLKDFLMQDLGLKRSWLKQFAIAKNFLNKELRPKDSLELPLGLLNKGMINPFYRGSAPRILSEDHDFLALEKPSRVHCHPLSYGESDNILSYLRAQNMFAALAVNSAHQDRGLLYRLDYETSGVLLLCKNERLHRQIRDDYHKIAKKKVYLAIVAGKTAESNYLKNSLSQSGKKIEIIADGAHATLEYERLAYDNEGDYSLLAVSLYSGLRHQIRVQLSSHGHPILGDELYGDSVSRKSPFQRLCLHAYHYQLVLDGKKLDFYCNWELVENLFLDLDSRLKMFCQKLGVR